MNADSIKIEILEDGTIKTTTDPISNANHQNAEAFLKMMGQLAGGDVNIERRRDRHAHHHHHGEEGEHTQA